MELTSNYLKYKRVVVFFVAGNAQILICQGVSVLIRNHFTCDLLSAIETLVK